MKKFKQLFVFVVMLVVILIIFFIEARTVGFKCACINGSIGIVIVGLWYFCDPFIHEFGHALCLRILEKKSLITIKFFKNFCFEFFGIWICLTNKKEFRNFAYSQSDYSKLKDYQIRIVALSGIGNSLINILFWGWIANCLNAWSFLFAPLIFVLEAVLGLVDKSSFSDFVNLYYPQLFREHYKEFSNDAKERYVFPKNTFNILD